jgi:hypothetical protein
MTLPGYTAEVTLYRSTQAYRLSVASGGSTERIHPALYLGSVRSSPWFRVLTLLCCEGCWRQHGLCVPDDVWGCRCITDVPVLGPDAPSVD